MTTLTGAQGGLLAKVIAAQSTFRAVMNAMARPGTLQSVEHASDAPAPLMPATAAIAQALFDQDTPIWLDAVLEKGPLIADWMRFHTGAPVTSVAATARFAVIADAKASPMLDRFAFGSNDYPDRSTTLIVQVTSLTDGRPLALRGPGIDGAATLHLSADADDLVARLSVNERLFPRGIDVVFVAGDMIAAIPRTTRLTVAGG